MAFDSRKAEATRLLQSKGRTKQGRRQSFTLWQFACPSRIPAFLNRVQVVRWLVKPDTTFTAGDNLCHIKFTANHRQGYVGWQEYYLRAPQDGYLLGLLEKTPDPVKVNVPLGFFVPLLEWQAFVELLDSHDEKLSQYLGDEHRIADLEKELAASKRAQREAAGKERAPTAAAARKKEQEAALAEMVERLREHKRETAWGTKEYHTWLEQQALPECLALLQAPIGEGELTLLDKISSRDRTGLEQALQQFVARHVPFSLSELRRLQPILKRLNAAQARFAALDEEIRAASSGGELSAAEQEAFVFRQEQEVAAFYREQPRA